MLFGLGNGGAKKSQDENATNLTGMAAAETIDGAIGGRRSPRRIESRLPKLSKQERKKTIPGSLVRRGDKWLELVQMHDPVDPVPRVMKKIGMPFSKSPSGFNEGTFLVDTICKTQRCPVETLEQIDRDLPRTYPDVDFFANTDVRESLGRVLRALALEFPEVGYVQGMNFLGATIFLHTRGSEDKSFQLFRYMLECPKYRLLHVFLPDLPNLRRFSDIMESFICARHRKLHQHFKMIGLEPLFYSQNWIMTLFSYMAPFNQLAEIWDRFFERGWPAIFQISLALISAHKEKLLESDFEKAAQILRVAAEEPPAGLLLVADSILLSEEEVCLIQDAVDMKPIEIVQQQFVDDDEDLFEDSSTVWSDVHTPLSSVVSETHRKSIGSRPSLGGFTLGLSSSLLASLSGSDGVVFVEAQSLAFGVSSSNGSNNRLLTDE